MAQTSEQHESYAWYFGLGPARVRRPCLQCGESIWVSTNQMAEGVDPNSINESSSLVHHVSGKHTR